MISDPAKQIRLAVYARVSTEEQREGQTIDSQIAELQRFVGDKGWEIKRIYKDEGWSGGIIERPALDLLRDDASKGLFEAVLINDVDRLARDVVHLGVLKRDLERRGIQVIFKKLPAENTPTHDLLVNILGSFAEFERQLIADRTRRGKRYKVEVRKQFLGTTPAYGFNYVKKDRAAGKEGYLEIVPDEAGIVRQMFGWVDQEGLSARKVLGRLNEMNVPARKGPIWAKSSVLRILRSEIYAGVWYYNKLQRSEPIRPVKKSAYRKSIKSSNRLRPRKDWLPLVLPASLQIIERDQWDRVQQQLTRNFAFSSRHAKHSYLLSGLVKCGACNARYVGDPGHGRFSYRCMSRCKGYPMIKEDDLNEIVWKAVQEAILNPELITNQFSRFTEDHKADVKKRDMERQVIEREKKQLQIEESRLLEAYRTGIISAAQLGMELEKLSVRKNTLQARKSALRWSSDSTREVRKSIEDYCAEIAARLESFAFEEKQKFLRLVVQEIVFEGNQVRIRGHIPTNGSHKATQTGPDRNLEGLLPTSRIAGTELEHLGRNPTPQLEFTLQREIVWPVQPRTATRQYRRVA